MLRHEPVLKSVVGFCALLQIAFLPGYLLVRARRWANGELQTVLLSLGLSLLLNFYLVMLLVTLKLYRTPVVLGIFFLEVAVALAWPRRAAAAAPVWGSDLSRVTRFGEALWQGDWLHRAVRMAAVVWAGLALAQAGRQVTAHFGDIFAVWDEVASWNRWALDWAGNHWPDRTMSYPQLLPANLSLTYVFLHSTHLWMFARELMPLLPLATLLLLADLALRTRHYGFVLAIPITAKLIGTILGDFSFMGYADGPLAFLVATALYVAILEHPEFAVDAGRPPRESYLAAILAAAAALTKVSGWFACFAVAILVWSWRRDFQPASAELPRLRRWLAIALLLPLPWYAFAETRLVHAYDREVNTRELFFFSNRDRDVRERIQFGRHELMRNGGVGGLLMIGLGLTALGRRRWRWPAILGFAWSGVWAVGLSYDTRNMAPALPFLGLAAGMGAMQTLKERTRGQMGLAVLAVLLALAGAYPADELERTQAAQQENIGIRDINVTILQYLDQHGLEGKILTSYETLPFVPRLEPYYVHEYFHSMAVFQNNLKTAGVRYLLVSDQWCDADIMEFIGRKLSAGDYALITPIGHWQFIRIVR